MRLTAISTLFLDPAARDPYSVAHGLSRLPFPPTSTHHRQNPEVPGAGPATPDPSASTTPTHSMPGLAGSGGRRPKRPRLMRLPLGWTGESPTPTSVSPGPGVGLG